MSDLDALLAGIVADPHNAVRWLVMADWLEESGERERAELVRVHRELLRACTDPDAHPERPRLHTRMMELMRAGVQPCLPERTLTLPGGVELKMSFIPPGSFLMGSPESEADRFDKERRHLVTLTQGFWLEQTPTTQQQWGAVVDRNPSHFKGEKLPVETVSWDDAQAFCATLKEQMGVDARLPTEAEWEYAVRAGTTTPFYWGGDLNGTQANCNGENPYGTEERGRNRRASSAVGSYAEESPHPWRLVDMIGNVWEWCGDWLGDDALCDAVDPTGPESSSVRVYRGGSWADPAKYCRAASRFGFALGFKSGDLGFRIAADSTGIL